MKRSNLTVLSKFSLIILLYISIYYTFFAFNSKPWEGDSLAYHIPIAKIILNGSILNPARYFPHPTMQYSPGDGEAILALLLFAHIPLNFFNIIGLICLFISSILIAIRFGLEKNYAIIFAATICTLHTVDRWLLAQTIDIWLAVFYILTVLLLSKPEKKASYFIKLGFCAGMVAGTKYTGPLFLLILFPFYVKKIYKHLNVYNIILFLAPFSLFGLFWYIRNYALTGDPYFPQSIPFFKGIEWHIFDMAVWKIIFLYPTGFVRTLNAFFSEYTIWAFAIPFALFYNLYSHLNGRAEKYNEKSKLLIISLLNFILYFFMPSGPHDNLMVTGFRYTYPAFIPLILYVFIVAKNNGKQEFLSLISVTNMVMLTEFEYHPKILFVFIPLSLLVYFLDIGVNKKNKLQIKLFYKDGQ